MMESLSQIGLLDIPEEVVYGMILKYLNWNDILRFRRVCHATKNITNSYLLVNLDRTPEIEIDETTGRTFAAFLEMGIPTTKLFINNQSGYHFYEDLNSPDTGKSRREFMVLHGPGIKHLRVIQMNIWPSGEELNFLNSLVNIKTLKVSQFGWGRKIDSMQKAMKLVKQAPPDFQIYKDAFPNSFKGLEKIRIGKNSENEVINQLMPNSEILLQFQQLKFASLPFIWQDNLPSLPIELNMSGSLIDEFSSMAYYTNPRPNNLYTKSGQLEICDFINYHDNIGGWDQEKTKEILPVYWGGSMSFLMLCDRALKTGLRLRNVSAFWFYARDANNGRFSGNHLGIPVVSLRGLDPSIMSLDMPNLEKITIPHTSRCGICDQDGRPEWPALKSLDVMVDDWIVKSWDFKGQNDWQPELRYLMTGLGGLWRLLFKDVVRTNLACLKLKFEKNGRWQEKMDLNGIVPKVEDIWAACPNLGTIELNNWPGTNKALVKLWERLPGLKEICLVECSNVGNVTFVGENKERPIFVKLKNLKKLTLKGLEKMPKITDLLFSLVLVNMSLKELVLTSDKPLEKVTKDGIEALLHGPFGKSIEKFPFRNWSLGGVTADEFQQLGMKFRSHQMI